MVIEHIALGQHHSIAVLTGSRSQHQYDHEKCQRQADRSGEIGKEDPYRHRLFGDKRAQQKERKQDPGKRGYGIAVTV